MEGGQTTMHVLVMVVFIVTMLVSVVGNLVVVIVFLRHRGLRTVTNSFLVNVAIADILTGCVSIPLSLVTYTVSTDGEPIETVCVASVSSTLLTVGASISFLMWANLDRFVAIHFPLRYSKIFCARTVVTLTLISWGFFIIFSLSPAMGWHSAVKGTQCDLMIVLHPVQGMIVIVVYISTFITLVCLNIKIYCTAKNQSKCIRVQVGSLKQSQERIEARSNNGNLPRSESQPVDGHTQRSSGTDHNMVVLGNAARVTQLRNHSRSLASLLSATPSGTSTSGSASSNETNRNYANGTTGKKPRKSNSFDFVPNVKALKVVTTVVMAYSVCHFPAAVLIVTHIIARLEGYDTSHFHNPFICILAVTYVNSAMNPFIYYRVIPPFRFEVRRLLCCDSSRHGRIIYSSCHRRELSENS